MRIIRLRNWAGFRAIIYKQWSIPPAERVDTWFRGLSDSRWSLQTTLDRFGPFVSREDRSARADSLLAHFRKELIGLSPRGDAPEGLALELLARHHGLPSELMDWTESPYIAAFFTFQGALKSDAKAVAVWALNLALLPAKPRNRTHCRPRKLVVKSAAHFRNAGYFIRLKRKTSRPKGCWMKAADQNGPASASECTMVLQDLEAMNITARNLFRDLDGAARTAITRFHLERAEHG